MRAICAIDPGTNQSAVVRYTGDGKISAAILPNEEVFGWLQSPENSGGLYVEMVAPYGMLVGQEVFDTAAWAGRFAQAREGSRFILRRVIKLHHCGQVTAKDANVRRALMDKYGNPGTKRLPGATYGLKADMWQAFAIAAYVAERWDAGLEPQCYRLGQCNLPKG